MNRTQETNDPSGQRTLHCRQETRLMASIVTPSHIQRIQFVALVLGLIFAASEPLESFAAPAGPDQQEELGKFVMFYYQNPHPDRAPELLGQFLKYLPVSPPDRGITRELTAYFFGRIAQGHPEIVRRYEELFPNFSPESQELLLRVLTQCGDEITKAQMEQWAAHPALKKIRPMVSEALKKLGEPHPEPSSREIKTPTDMDLLWVEFFATGTKKPVQQLINVLDRPDYLRTQLEEWLKSHPGTDDRAQMARWLKTTGIRFNPVQGRFISQGDLDVQSARSLQLAMQRGIKHRFGKIAAELGLTEQSIRELVLKGAAAWAIESNGVQHPLLVDFYEEELKNHRGGHRSLLLKIVAASRFRESKYSRAIALLEEAARLVPDDMGTQELLGRTYLEIGATTKAQEVLQHISRISPASSTGLRQEIAYQQLELLTVGSAEEVPLADGSNTAIINACIARSENLLSYRTKRVIKDLSTVEPSKTKDGAAIQWVMEHVRPNRFAVEQIAWADNSADKWLSIGEDHYQFFGFWMNMSNVNTEAGQKLMDYARYNQSLQIDEYIDLLKNEKLIRAWKIPNTPYLVCQYEPPSSVEFQEGVSPQKASTSVVTLWLNSSTSLLEKATTLMSGVDEEKKPFSTRVEQLFIDYDAEISIERPTDLPLDSPNAEKHPH